MPRGRQTDILTASKATALADLGYSGPQIEGMTGLNARTVWGILNGEASWGEVKETSVFKANRLRQKEALEAATRLLAAKCLVEVENKIGAVSAYQAVGMYGILRQNERLDAGEPTEISMNVNASMSLDDLLDRLGQRLIQVNPEDKK
jgi:hypothetical protein